MILVTSQHTNATAPEETIDLLVTQQGVPHSQWGYMIVNL